METFMTSNATKNKNIRHSWQQYTLRAEIKEEISKLFVQKSLERKNEAFKHLDKGISDYLNFSIIDRQYPDSIFEKDLLKAQKHSKGLFDAMNNMSVSAYDYFNAHAFETSRPDIPREQTILILKQIADATDAILSDKNPAQYRHIHHVTSSVAEIIDNHSNYKVNESQSGKLYQIMEILLPELSATLKQGLSTEEVPVYDARNLVNDYMIHKYTT